MASVSPHVKAVRSRLIGRFNETFGADKQSTYDLSSTQTETSPITDSKEYAEGDTYDEDIADGPSSQILFNETEKLLEKWKHPDPYRPPTAPGGSKYERNVPAPDLPPPSKEFVKRL
ncbi:hypothetical protein H2200_004837 [Cladophialophora chaetospira]|uniref:NADH dehydrogenase [ubiquinone] 1 beta subcomplex subunit 9 n=1 Tax=Cladophialophora chaetospira TaxID=386627 RepID=A0AA38XDU4_9EURO|nr:hypothetical protein H2200_004837 [Cladophialophora chaetospira]